jgi:hypothetical protein
MSENPKNLANKICVLSDCIPFFWRKAVLWVRARRAGKPVYQVAGSLTGCTLLFFFYVERLFWTVGLCQVSAWRKLEIATKLKSTNYSEPTNIKSYGISPSSTREDREMTVSSYGTGMRCELGRRKVAQRNYFQQAILQIRAANTPNTESGEMAVM